MTSRIKLRWVAVVAGAIFLLAHLPSIAWFLDDIDAINFAMGLREYDIAKHQPHPPVIPFTSLSPRCRLPCFTRLARPRQKSTASRR